MADHARPIAVGVYRRIGGELQAGRLDQDQGRLFYLFCLDDAVPGDRRVREIAAVLDLSWMHAELAASHFTSGRPCHRNSPFECIWSRTDSRSREDKARTDDDRQLVDARADARLLAAMDYPEVMSYDPPDVGSKSNRSR